MIRIEELSESQLKELKAKADRLLSERYRSYLPGRMLAVLLSKYRDDLAEALGVKPPEIPQREGQARKATLDELTTPELNEAMASVLLLVTWDMTMDDPALPDLLREFRAALEAQQRERNDDQRKFTTKAKAAHA